MRIMLLFSVISAYTTLCLLLAWSYRQSATIAGSDGQHLPSDAQPDASSHRVIIPEMAELAQRLMKKGDIRGLAAGVVRWSEDPSASNPDVEFGSWGIMSEQGANVTPDVSS